VTTCTEEALRAAMAGGGTVTFACDGTITLASTITNGVDLTLDSSGHSVTISGVQAFYVSPGTRFTLVGVTIANCCAPSGGGIFNDGGILNLGSVVFQNNTANWDCSTGMGLKGGAILNQGGQLNATNCIFAGNSAIYPINPDFVPRRASGGAVCNQGGAVNLQQCVFTGNWVVGGPGASGLLPGAGVEARGGAIYTDGSLAADSCAFSGNSASGGNGGDALQSGSTYPGGLGGRACGGAICNLGGLTVSRSLFTSNSVSGGGGGAGAAGGRHDPYPGASGGAGGTGGDGSGGALYGGGLLVNCTFAADGASGGAGGPGGHGGDSTSVGGQGGQGGNGGSAFGAIGDANDGLTLVNCSIASNSANFGSGGAGGSAGYGPHGTGGPGPAGTNGVAGGGVGTSGSQLMNTLLATNSPGGNCHGSITDLGHNLSSDGTCNFTNSGSLNNTDPKLGPLANNGGPTLTMALLSGSPAIDAGDASPAPLTDQRGFPRPAGLAADIGAFEYGSVMPTIAVTRSGTNGLNILATGNANQSCRLLWSPDLSSWVPLATNQIGGDGTILFYDDCTPGRACRFYRLVMP
jgi:hypothetical protein